jgi:hypothetical protein
MHENYTEQKLNTIGGNARKGSSFRKHQAPNTSRVIHSLHANEPITKTTLLV